MPNLTAGSVVYAADFPPSVYDSDDTSNLNISSTTYIAGTPEVGVVFTAPTTGRVELTIGGGLRDSSGANRVHLSPQVFLGTSAAGTEILAPTVVTRGVGSPAESVNYMYYSRTTLLEGLTPGASYYARTMHKVSGGATADIAARDISVAPAP